MSSAQAQVISPWPSVDPSVPPPLGNWSSLKNNFYSSLTVEQLRNSADLLKKIQSLLAYESRTVASRSRRSQKYQNGADCSVWVSMTGLIYRASNQKLLSGPGLCPHGCRYAHFVYSFVTFEPTRTPDNDCSQRKRSGVPWCCPRRSFLRYLLFLSHMTQSTVLTEYIPKECFALSSLST